ncbi:Periplasmic trehalase [Emticicia aquatica]|uniref:Periplasmic trehalase n=1 Tax=Emticicia aquatica TaxID=1681835 RepID=A0ABN8F1P6_9BACT|nr:trehalase family glycosidase [Emticicia aquatica]CAH0997749.1 Periplasmic trehalase [Emticicia aquatica]
MNKLANLEKTTDSKTLIQHCKDVLNQNWRDGFTVPSSNLYPFQWLWDSGFIAMGWSFIDMERARQEIKTLLAAQWSNGFLPHIIFHDDSAEKQYFPGADFQGAYTNAFAPKHVKTSGITQPPVLGFVLEYLFEKEYDLALHKEFYVNAIQSIVHFHEYLYLNRDPYNEGLVYIRHNWESGTDNSAAWDSIWKTYTPPTYDVQRKDTSHVNQAQRPTKKDYNYYLHLIELSKQCEYDEKKMFEELPFLVQDPLFNSLLVASNESLVRMAIELNMPEVAQKCSSWLTKTSLSINEKLYDEKLGLYGYYDLKNNRFISIATSMGFSPLFAGIVPQERALRMTKIIEGVDFQGTDLDGYLCPSLAYTDPEFDAKRYWRGPVWLNINWLLYKGFTNYGFKNIADKIKNDSITLVAQNGFYEYFSPIPTENEQNGFGGQNFSWTAAMLLDMLN